MARYPIKHYGTALGTRLRALRLKAGYTQQNVADTLNVNRSTYTCYELGKTEPDTQTLKRLAKILDVPIELFFDDDPLPPMFNDSRRRAPKKPASSPENVGQLTATEKAIIAYIRDRKLHPDTILEALHEEFDKDDNHMRYPSRFDDEAD